MTVLPGQLAGLVRTLLRSADHPATASGTAATWRAERDRWLDALDPSMPAEFDEATVRRLIDFLSESGPSRSSRKTQAEWSREVDEIVPMLLFSTGG